MDPKPRCPECGSEELRYDACTGEVDCVECGALVPHDDDPQEVREPAKLT